MTFLVRTVHFISFCQPSSECQILVIAVHLMLQVTELLSKFLWADCYKVHREGFPALAGFWPVFAEMLILKFNTSISSINV